MTSMTSYMNVIPSAQYESEDWGHFIDIDNSLITAKNRGRSITCPVIHGNKVYQKPYTYYDRSFRVEQNTCVSSYNGYILNVIENILRPCLNIMFKKSKINDEQKNKNVPVQVRSLLDITTHQNDQTTKTVRFQPTTRDTYTIDETSEDDYDDMYKNSKMSVSMMATVSIVSIYVVYILL